MEAKKTLFAQSVIIIVFGLLALSSATVHTPAYVTPFAKSPETTLNAEMRDFLSKRKNLSVVLRVPYSSDKVTTEDLSRNNEFYNTLEAHLIKAGYTVRDRGLLEQLLSSKTTLNYKEISTTIGADLIIELTNINWKTDNYQQTYVLDNKKQQQIHFKEQSKQLNPFMAKLDCKFTIVEQGLTGGILTCYYSSCDKCYFNLVDGEIGYESWGFNQDRQREAFDYFSGKIIEVLRSGQK